MATTTTFNDQPIATHNDFTLPSDRVFMYGSAVGRILFSIIFIISGVGHFRSDMIAFASSQGLPMASFLVPLAGILFLIGGVSVAIGHWSRAGALLLILSIIPVTFMMHNFWTYTDPVLRQMQFVHFLKNLALIGGALQIAHYGSGPISVDTYMQRKRARQIPSTDI